jgi:hypothetical protein
MPETHPSSETPAPEPANPSTVPQEVPQRDGDGSDVEPKQDPGAGQTREPGYDQA